jgi:hypothetical protein
MTTTDPTVLSKRIFEFATNVVPALCVAASQTMQLGIPFNLQRAMTDLADNMDLADYVQDWFDDPEFLNRVQFMIQMGPQLDSKKVGISPQGVRQNGGYPGAMNFGKNLMSQQPQELAGIMQSAMKGGG